MTAGPDLPADPAAGLDRAPVDLLELLDLLPDALIAADAHAVVVFANDRVAAVTGRPARDFLGQDLRSVLPLVDDRGRDWWARVDPWRRATTDLPPAPPENPQRETALRLGGGIEVLVTLRVARRDDSGPTDRVVVSLREPADRPRSGAESAALISTMAHELRSPLTSVKGFTSSLLAHWDRFTDEQKRFMIETIDTDAGRVGRLISELLDLSRLDAGRMAIHPVPLDLRVIVERHFRREAARGVAADRLRLVADPDCRVLADPDRIEQVVSNLVENALRHGAGRVTVTVCPEPVAPPDPADRPGPPVVQLVVDDEGEGVDEDLRDRIFDRYWHGSRRGSTGLGLYVVRGIVEAHSGWIRVGRAPSGGARFVVRLPAAVRPD